MKKTFKVKNILKNKNKYNFKTELLLSALSLLVAFGTVSCKKDPVKPKNNTEQNEKNYQEMLKKFIMDSTTYARDLGKIKSEQFFKGEAITLMSTFWNAAVDPEAAKCFLDSVKGTCYNPNGEYMKGTGYKRTAELMKKYNYNNLNKEETEVLDSIISMTDRYLKHLDNRPTPSR